MYDVAIIGLGPAGATLARLLDKNLRVLALDKKGDQNQSEGFQKPCGGLLAPDAQKTLALSGLTLPLDVLVDPQIFSVRTVDVRTRQQRYYQRFYMNLDRHRFDLWLKSLIPSRVEVRHQARCTGIAPCGEGYRVTWQEGGQEHAAAARYLVGADGASSRVRRFLYPQANIRSYLCVQQWFFDRHPTPSYSCVFDCDATDCYAWGLSKGEYFLFGGAFSPQGARQELEGLKEKLKPFGFCFDAPVKTEACLVMRPLGHQFYTGRENAFLLGEAAGFVSPSSLEGISYAMDSAQRLSRALNGGAPSPQRVYRKATGMIRRKLLLKNLKSPFMYWPRLRRLVMASGLQSIDVRE